MQNGNGEENGALTPNPISTVGGLEWRERGGYTPLPTPLPTILDAKDICKTFCARVAWDGDRG